jgi:hypothetical protein
MGLFRAIADVVYKEYDRRVRRASLVKEYGVSHHHDHADESHAADGDEHAGEDEAEIMNVPRGTPIATATQDEASGSDE